MGPGLESRIPAAARRNSGLKQMRATEDSPRSIRLIMVKDRSGSESKVSADAFACSCEEPKHLDKETNELSLIRHLHLGLQNSKPLEVSLSLGWDKPTRNDLGAG